MSHPSHPRAVPEKPQSKSPLVKHIKVSQC